VALYFRLLGAGLRARMQYKLDFLVTTLLYALITAIDFLIVAAILFRYQQVEGWTLYQVAILSGMTGSAYGLYRTFCSELEGFERYLVTGDFDNLLIRPWPTLASLLSRNFDLGRIGALLQGLTLVSIGIVGAGAPWWVWPYLVLSVPAGACIISALSLAVSASGFWLVRIADLQTFAVNAPNAASNYPMEIFPKWLRWLFTGVLPVAATAYLPMRYALHKGGSALSLLAPFAAAGGAMAVALAFWRHGERHYQSTGN
jgi:ABC-2 type transport system permease protein